MENQIIEGFHVSFPTIASEVEALPFEHRRPVKIKIFTAGGCMSFMQGQTEIDHVRSLLGDAVADTMTIGGQVVIFRDFLKGMTDEEVKAIVYHEIGHLKFDHMSQFAHACNDLNLMVSVTAELEADAFSASIVGKEVMKSALHKIITNFPDVVMQWSNDSVVKKEVELEIQQVFASEMITARFKALS